MPVIGNTDRLLRDEVARTSPANGREEPQSIKDDLVQRLYAVYTTLIILNERLGYLADRIKIGRAHV